MWKRGAKFAFVGVVCTLISYAAYWLALRFGAHYLGANAAGWICGVGLGFVLNRRMTFRVQGAQAWRRQLVMFVIGAVAQLGLSSLGLTLLIGGLGLGPLLAFVINTIILSALNFAWLHFVFRKSENAA
jgi:putative flippase GtrA